MRETLDAIWVDLGREDVRAGVLKRLLDADWSGQISAVVLKPGNEPGIQLDIEDAVGIDLDSLVASEAVNLTTSGDERGLTSIRLTLADPNYGDTFTILAADLAEHVLATESERDGVLVLVRHLSRWLRFMKRRRPGLLSRERQMGLYGELSVMCNLIAPAVGFEAAVRSWEGPVGAYQDFQLGSVVIEAKTLSATQPQQLPINSERQLDDQGIDALILAHLAVSLLQETGTTLPDLVGQVRVGLGMVGTELELFEDRLFEVGYLDSHAHLYAQTGYVDRGINYYRVRAGFPRLVETELQPGMGSVRYKVDASACVGFEVTADQLVGWISDSPPPVGAIEEEESLHLEHKATAWKSMTRDIPDKVINEAVVKTVAGFLNSEGGTLVIGLEDRTREVLGVEIDLEYLGTDLDGYQMRLATLFSTCLGGAAAARVKIRFERHDDLEVCLVSVLPSSRPILAHSPVGKKKNVFWVRTANSTRELQLDQALEYIRDHWG